MTTRSLNHRQCGTAGPSTRPSRRVHRAHAEASRRRLAPAMAQQAEHYSGAYSTGCRTVTEPEACSLLLSDLSQAPTPDLLSEALPALTPKQLADAISSFAKQGGVPSAACMEAIAAEVLTKLEHFRSSDLANTIWALAVLKYQPSVGWWDAFERQVYQHVTDFSDRELANLLWSLAVLDHRPAWVLEPLLAAAQDSFCNFSPNALHLLGWSCGKLGYCPSKEWLDSYLRAAQNNFFQFSPAEMSNIIWALAKIGYKLPSLWLDNFLMVAQWRFPSFSAKTLGVVAWAVASLGHTPSEQWLVSYEQQIREKFWDFSGQELACIAWALRRFGATPEHNAVFYMLERQENFLAVDFEILSNSKLLGQVRHWRQGEGAEGAAGAEGTSAPDDILGGPSSSLGGSEETKI